MRLRRWMEIEGKTLRPAAKALGTNISTLSRICTGSQDPSGELARRIVAWTKGEVTLEDLLGKRRPQAPERASA